MTSTPSTLLDLLEHAPADKIAIVIPEQQLKVSYGALRAQVQGLAEQFAALGIRRGDRIGIALPNGLPVVVAFLAASVAGTAAPLNPGYKEEEFRFYLEDTDARVLILPPDGAEDARRAAGDGVPIVTIDVDASGTVTLGGNGGGGPVAPPPPHPNPPGLHTHGTTPPPHPAPPGPADPAVFS